MDLISLFIFIMAMIFALLNNYKKKKENFLDNKDWKIDVDSTNNLVFKFKQEHMDFVKGPLNNRCGTSWDPNIRFGNEKQANLWRKNVKDLVDEGVTVKLFISVTKDTIANEPIELFKYEKWN